MEKKHKSTRNNFKKGIVFACKIGDLFEERVGKTIEDTRLQAPYIPEDPQPMTWYRVPIPEGISGDGSEYYIYSKIADPSKLCIFFSGGGVAWNEYTAARPITSGKVATGLPNYYYNNLRPFTQIMNINLGITDMVNPKNPFRDWSFVVITYATGDFHVGSNQYEYKAVNGSNEVLHFNGYQNFRKGMEEAKKLFPSPEKILIAGNSAGAFAVPALTSDIVEDYYQECQDVTLLSDSAQLYYEHWKKTAKNIWKCKEDIWKPINGDNIAVEWYKNLYAQYGDRFKYLYASSTHDYLLSAYYNDVTNKKYATDEAVQGEFYDQLHEMVKELKKISPDFRIYLNDWKIPLVTKKGTVHTSVREPYFTVFNVNGITMSEWLSDATCGKLYDVGLNLL